jgi:hypothetical protein
MGTAPGLRVKKNVPIAHVSIMVNIDMVNVRDVRWIPLYSAVFVRLFAVFGPIYAIQKCG